MNDHPWWTVTEYRINATALAGHLPTMYGSRENGQAGGLMSYGADFADMLRRAAVLVDKILKGAAPAALPGGATDQV